jgi:hypothetical protein
LENGLAITKKRAALLRELEDIVGRSFYNRKTQNYGPGGVRQGEGREIRYPISFRDDRGEKIKRHSGYDDLSVPMQMTGHYVLGTNNLHIMESLDKVLRFLEENNGLKI